MRTLSELRVGEVAFLVSIETHELQLKLLTMGCTPQTQIEIINIAPLGDPMAIKVGNCTLSIRKQDASKIKVEK